MAVGVDGKLRAGLGRLLAQYGLVIYNFIRTRVVKTGRRAKSVRGALGYGALAASRL